MIWNGSMAHFTVVWKSSIYKLVLHIKWCECKTCDNDIGASSIGYTPRKVLIIYGSLVVLWKLFSSLMYVTVTCNSCFSNIK